MEEGYERLRATACGAYEAASWRARLGAAERERRDGETLARLAVIAERFGGGEAADGGDLRAAVGAAGGQHLD